MMFCMKSTGYFRGVLHEGHVKERERVGCYRTNGTFTELHTSCRQIVFQFTVSESVCLCCGGCLLVVNLLWKVCRGGDRCQALTDTVMKVDHCKYLRKTHTISLCSINISGTCIWPFSLSHNNLFLLGGRSIQCVLSLTL